MLIGVVGNGRAGALGEKWWEMVTMNGRQHEHRSDAMVEIVGLTPEGIQLIAGVKQLLAIQPRRQ
jgi:hypothetical protein